MLFWIIVALVAIVTIACFIGLILDDFNGFWFSFGVSAMVAVIASVVGGGLTGLVWWWGVSVTPFEKASESDTSLRAIQTRETIEGSFHGGIFASYGYVDGVRVISYITQDEEGGIRLGYVRASQSVVYEDETDPYITTFEWQKNNWVFLPWTMETANTYAVHVPEGSVVDGFEVAP